MNGRRTKWLRKQILTKWLDRIITVGLLDTHIKRIDAIRLRNPKHIKRYNYYNNSFRALKHAWARKNHD